MKEIITQTLLEYSNHLMTRLYCLGRFLTQILRAILTIIEPNAANMDMGGALVIAERILRWGRNSSESLQNANKKIRIKL